MARNVRVTDNRIGFAESVAPLTVPAGAGFHVIQSKMNDESSGLGIKIGIENEIVVRIKVTGTMPAGSIIVLTPAVNGFGEISTVVKTLGAVTDDTITARIADNDNLTDCDNTLITYNFIKDAVASYVVSLIGVQIKKKSELTTLPAEKTTQDLEWYIDPVNGSDESGDGSVVFPFKSFACLDSIPPIIEHEIKIYPKAGDYTYFPEVFDRQYYGAGRVIIDASLETFPVVAGPFTLTGKAGVGPNGPDGVPLGTDLTVAGAGWTVDEYKDKLIKMTSGNWNGYCLPVYKNTADTIETYADWYTFAAGNTFNFVNCPVRITVPNSILIKGNKYSFNYAPTKVNDAPISGAFYMCGVRLNVNGTRQDRFPIRIVNINCTFSACVFQNDWNPASGFDHRMVQVFNSIINVNEIPAGTFGNIYLSDYYSLAFNVCFHPSATHDPTYPMIDLEDSSMNSFCTRGSLWIGAQFNAAGKGCSMAYFIAGSLYIGRTPYTYIGYFLCDQLAYTKEVINVGHGYLYLGSCYIRAGGQPLTMYSAAFVESDWFKKGSVTAAYALLIKSCSRFNRVSTNTDIVGTTNAYQFGFNAAAGAWPANGSTVNDTAGSFILSKW